MQINSWWADERSYTRGWIKIFEGCATISLLSHIPKIITNGKNIVTTFFQAAMYI